ncbi:MAG: hypothetical protein JRJ70_14980 [Deltaproteobacteria bacterium]|nr:hypothetical protein [Deltaproteobacteria bacterium]
MNNEEEIRIAWSLWHLMARLSELIWHRYEREFIERYVSVEEEHYGERQSEKGPLGEPG